MNGKLLLPRVCVEASITCWASNAAGRAGVIRCLGWGAGWSGESGVWKGWDAQVVDVTADDVSAGPHVGLVDDAWLLGHVGYSPEDGLLDEEAVRVWHRAEWLRSVVLPCVYDVEVVPTPALGRLT